MGGKWLIRSEGRFQIGIQEKKKRNINNNKWNKIWCSNGLPKVKAFFWILAHRKTLTYENLRKRGIVRPSHCILCKEAEESLEHLFTQCKFTQEVWSIVLRELKMNITMPTNWNDIFSAGMTTIKAHSNKNQILSEHGKLSQGLYAGKFGLPETRKYLRE